MSILRSQDLIHVQFNDMVPKRPILIQVASVASGQVGIRCEGVI